MCERKLETTARMKMLISVKKLHANEKPDRVPLGSSEPCINRRILATSFAILLSWQSFAGFPPLNSSIRLETVPVLDN